MQFQRDDSQRVVPVIGHTVQQEVVGPVAVQGINGIVLVCVPRQIEVFVWVETHAVLVFPGGGSHNAHLVTVLQFVGGEGTFQSRVAESQIVSDFVHLCLRSRAGNADVLGIAPSSDGKGVLLVAGGQTKQQ